MDNEQSAAEPIPGKLSGFGAKLREAAEEEAQAKKPPPPKARREPTEQAGRRKLDVVGRAEKRTPRKAKPTPSAGVESPKQATVKMDERMRMAWALMRATSGRTLQELQYEAFHEFLKRNRAFDLVDLHTGTMDQTSEG